MTKSITSPRIALLVILIWSAAGFNATAAMDKPELPHGFQPGFIITLENDTIHGLVEFGTSRNSHLRCRFMHSAADEVQTFGPRELNGYGFGEKLVFNTKAIDLKTFLKHVDFDINQLQEDDEIIHLLQHFDFVFSDPESDVEPVLQTADGNPITLQPLFMKVILLSEVSMYSYGTLFFAQPKEGEVYLLRQIHSEVVRGGTTYRITTNEYLGILNLLTQNCPQVNAEVMGTRFTLKAIRDILISYNECIEYPLWLPQPEPPAVRINPGITLHSGLSSLSFKTNPRLVPADGRRSEVATTLYPGIYVDIVFPRSNNMVNLSLGMQLMTLEFSDYTFIENPIQGHFKQDQYFLKQSYLTVPLELHYRPFKSNFHTSFIAGANLNFNIGEDHINQTTGIAEDTGIVVYTNYRTFHNSKTFNPGIITGFDVRKSLGWNFYIAAGVRYEITSNVFNIRDNQKISVPLTEQSNIQSFTFKISIMREFDNLFQ